MEEIEKKFCPHCKRVTIMVLATMEGVPYRRCMLCLNLIKEDMKIVPPEESVEVDKEGEQWEAMMASIRGAAKILNIDLTEEDAPEYMNWLVGRTIHRDLWARVYARKTNRR